MHLELAYIPDAMLASRYDALGRPLEPTPDDREHFRSAMEQNNCTFEKIEMLPHDIGYLKLNSFPDLSICRPKAEATMASLNHVNAILFDLRDNRGGQPEMVSFVAGYLFDHPEYWYNPRENTTQKSWTQSPVKGSKLADKPVYVLTSARTASGAEQFCYNLKMLKRATLVGETTSGSAHSGVWHRIDEHFGMGIPEVKPVNPYAKSDWEGTGVEPDVKVKAEDALKTAEDLALRKLQKK
jgi:C-terminal processing protease CtpA/Prc